MDGKQEWIFSPSISRFPFALLIFPLSRSPLSSRFYLFAYLSPSTTTASLINSRLISRYSPAFSTEGWKYFFILLLLLYFLILSRVYRGIWFLSFLINFFFFSRSSKHQYNVFTLFQIESTSDNIVLSRGWVERKTKGCAGNRKPGRRDRFVNFRRNYSFVEKIRENLADLSHLIIHPSVCVEFSKEWSSPLQFEIEAFHAHISPDDSRSI